ncbi:unnamed protein product, partial [Meganyctiphanes norvegica]
DEQKYQLLNVHELKIDGTFKITVKPHYQLVSLHGSWKRPGEVRPRSAPLAYILMQGKAEEDYISVFHELKSLVEDGGGSMKLKRVLVDFELAIWNAVHVVWGKLLKFVDVGSTLINVYIDLLFIVVWGIYFVSIS